ncbi:MAG: rhomboid family intramembrane serine protease [Dehalococcoidales bacterium]
MPLNDRDYMKQPSSPPPRRRLWTGGGTGGFLQNPVYIIIIINLIIYLASFINSDKLVNTFGLSPSLFTQQPWTILTNMFVHVEFWHIFGNMLTLFFFGQVVYQLVGTKWFLLVYFVGGIVGNLGYIWLGDPYSIAIGASGAIFALTGALVVMMPTMRVNLWGIIPMPLWAFVLIFMVLWSIPNLFPGIAWQGHLGGLLVGLATGFFFRRKRRVIYYR